MKPVIFSDVDGVLTKDQKIYYEKDSYQVSPYVPTEPVLMPFISPLYPTAAPVPQGQWIRECELDDYHVEDNNTYNYDYGGDNNSLILDNPPNDKQLISVQKELFVAKQFSDKDSYILHHIKNIDSCKVVLISGDERVSHAWARRQGVEFLYCSPQYEKYDLVSTWLKANYYDESDFYYIGDAMPDYKCLIMAKMGFLPNDVSQYMYNKLMRTHDSTITKSWINGGEGLLDFVYSYLVDISIIKE